MIFQKNQDFQIIFKVFKILTSKSDKNNLYVNQLTQINRKNYRDFILKFIFYRCCMCKGYNISYNHINMILKNCKNKQISDNNF